MPHSMVSLVVVLVGAGALVSAAAVAAMAWSLLRPPRMTDGKALAVLRRMSPGDLGLRYEDAPFEVRDEHRGRALRLAAWWIPAAGAGADRCVVLLHGYADAKVGAVAWAPPWHAMGFHVLAIDLRAHGESGGAYCTAGYFERHDVEQVIGRLRAERPAQTRKVVLFGASLGAAVAAAAAELRDDVAAVVMESPFADFRTAAMAHMDLLGLPGGEFQRAALALAERLSGAKFDAVRPVDVVRRLRCPVLIVAPGADAYVAPSDGDFEAALSARPAGAGAGEIWRPDESAHLLAATTHPEEYRRRLEKFLSAALDASRSGGGPPDSASAAVNAGGSAV